MGINVYFSVNTCAPAVNAGVLATGDIACAIQHAKAIGEISKRIYNRACDSAVNNSNDLLLAIESSEDAHQSPVVQVAVEEHRNDLKRFQQGEVDANVPKKSHERLLESIKQTGLDQKPNVREKAEQSSRAWDIAILIGSIVLAAGTIIGIAVLKSRK